MTDASSSYRPSRKVRLLWWLYRKTQEPLFFVFAGMFFTIEEADHRLRRELWEAVNRA